MVPDCPEKRECMEEREVKKCFFIIIICAGLASARDQDGLLSTIITPNEGRPAIVVRGDTFEVDLAHKVDYIALNNRKLTVEWQKGSGSNIKAVCNIPSDFPAGAYTIEAVSGNKKDANSRSVFVLDAFPEQYTVAHISDPRNPGTLREMAATVNEARASFVLITGNLTENGSIKQFNSLLRSLKGFEAPTFLSPDKSDRTEGFYEKVFGDPIYMFKFSKDGYISIDTSRLDLNNIPDNQNGRLHMLRRAIKSCRWSTGFTSRYETSLDIRTQMALFIDNPLDFLLSGAETATQSKTPWGNTITVTTAPADMAGPNLFVVSAKGIESQPDASIQ